MEKRYVTKVKRVQAREVSDQSEFVETYNGFSLATQGDFVVHDEHGRTMVIKREKFTQRYEEVADDN